MYGGGLGEGIGGETFKSLTINKYDIHKILIHIYFYNMYKYIHTKYILYYIYILYIYNCLNIDVHRGSKGVVTPQAFKRVWVPSVPLELQYPTTMPITHMISDTTLTKVLKKIHKPTSLYSSDP